MNEPGSFVRSSEEISLVLTNGLRVCVSPDRYSTAVAISVAYDIGYRTEPKESAGLAHLFEHLMFRQKGNSSFARRVEALGGRANAATHADMTIFTTTGPSGSLRELLLLEGDRMMNFSADAEILASEINVVIEEIETNITNKAYGGFPWMHLPDIAFPGEGAGHNGYGAIESLSEITLQQAERFFRAQYSPNHASVVIVGDVDQLEATDLLEEAFGQIPSNASRGDIEEKGFKQLVESQIKFQEDRFAPRDAIAIAWPVDKLEANFIATALVLAEILVTPRSRGSLRDEGTGISKAYAYLGNLRYPWSVASPSLFTVECYLEETQNHAAAAHLIEVLLASVPRWLDDDAVMVASKKILNRHYKSLDSIVGFSIRRSMDLLLARRTNWQEQIPNYLLDVRASAVSSFAQSISSSPRASIYLSSVASREMSK
jgi:zinc protease